MLTVISKCLGTVAKWPDHFDGITELGYNAIHFTPLQVRGTSQNPYSIAD
jgi:glycogen debranching enzyme